MIRISLKILVCLIFNTYLFSSTNIVNAQNPVAIGTPVKVSENRGQLAVAINGKPFIAVFAHDNINETSRNSLLLIDIYNGTTEQYWYPTEESANGTLFHMLSASNNCIYTTIGHEFVEFNLLLRQWTFSAKIDGLAMSFTEAPDGKIYFGTFPNSSVWEYNPKLQKLSTLGRLDLKEKYPGSLVVDKDGWLYGGVGTARGNLVAINTRTLERIQLSNEKTRKIGYSEVFRGQDSLIYARESKSPKQFLRLSGGMSSPVVGEVLSAPQRNTHFNKFKVNDFLTGGKILSCDLSSKQAMVLDKSSKVIKISFDYKTNGSKISSLTVGEDGNIYGSTNHPMHFFKYEPLVNLFTDYKGLEEVRGGNFPNLAPWNGKIVGPTYSFGTVYIIDPKLPWGHGRDEKVNPIKLGTFPQISRPRAVLILQDQETALFSGFPGYGRTGGGMVFVNLKTKVSNVLKSSEIPAGHSTIALRQLKNGQIVGGTSTQVPGGGAKIATSAILYLMDPLKRVIESKVDIGADIYSLEVTDDQKVIGLTIKQELFVFDPVLQKITLKKMLTGGALLNAGQSLIKDQNGIVYLILARSISTVSPAGEIKELCKLPSKATSGIALVKNTIYYASGSAMYKYTLPNRKPSL